MDQNRPIRGWGLVAAIAIGVALVLLLVPHAYSSDGGDLLAVLPILFAGMISPLSLLAPLASVYAGRTPEAPVLPAAFQRPPPSRLV